MPNLWSNTFTQNVEKNTPIALLREQANYLTEATGSFTPYELPLYGVFV